MLVKRFPRLSILWSALLCGAVSAHSGWAIDLSRLVVVGDSVSAGVQNASLEGDQQIHGYASVIARQANVKLKLPRVPYPGVPNVLQLTNLNPVTVTPVSAPPPPLPRVKPCLRPTNVSVPGVTLDQALNMLPAPVTSTTLPVQGWVDVVLGFPSPFGVGLCADASPTYLSEVQQAVALKPTAIITWLGNNDALVPAMTGILSLLTPVDQFASDYNQLLNQLGGTNAPILTATIPDVTDLAFFTPLSALVTPAHPTAERVAKKLGLQDPNDFLRPTAVQAAIDILQDKRGKPESLPDSCDAPALLQGLVSTVPCVLTGDDARTIRGRIAAFNTVIVAESIIHRAIVVDTYGLLNNLAQNGYDAAGKHLTTAFLGGILSLDGVHPTNTGYAIIANTFIDTINLWWGAGIPHADVDKIAANDPLVPPVKVQTQ